jgi:hypothetical protein
MYDLLVGDVIKTKYVNTAQTDIRVGTDLIVREGVTPENLDTAIPCLLGDIQLNIQFRHIWKLYRDNVLIFDSGPQEMWPPIRFNPS